MATNRRVSRVASLIKREVSSMLIGDIKDDRVGAGMVSVTDVDVSGDLQHAKIFVSIYGTEEAKLETMAGLTAATGYIRRELGARIRLRRTPEVLFCEDRSLERGDQTLHLLDRIRQEREAHPLPDVDTAHQTVTGAELPEDLEDEEFDDLDADLDDEFT